MVNVISSEKELYSKSAPLFTSKDYWSIFKYLISNCLEFHQIKVNKDYNLFIVEYLPEAGAETSSLKGLPNTPPNVLGNKNFQTVYYGHNRSNSNTRLTMEVAYLKEIKRNWDSSVTAAWAHPSDNKEVELVLKKARYKQDWGVRNLV